MVLFRMVQDHTTLIEGDDSCIMMNVYPFFSKGRRFAYPNMLRLKDLVVVVVVLALPLPEH
jgi:hypothetical protein